MFICSESHDILHDKCLMKKAVILQHDSAQLHTACLTLETSKNRWEVFPHPPYNPDLAPTDYHLFEVLRDHMRG
jgi:histone-lysine N-methyltransferase SETMAR